VKALPLGKGSAEKLKQEWHQVEIQAKHLRSAAPEETPKVRSEGLGVSVAYILGEFADDARAAAREAQRDPQAYGIPAEYPVRDAEDPNFHEVGSVLCKGSRSKGKGKVCPRDGKADCSVVDALDSEKCGKAGKATHFLSWVWQYQLSVFIAAIRHWIVQESLDPNKTFLWVCFFCNNQHRLGESNADNLEEVFESRLKTIGHMVALLDTWRIPVYVTRIWCVFEQYTAVKLMKQDSSFTVQMVLPPNEMESFNQTIAAGNMQDVITEFSSINVETARATVDKDEETVKKLIRESVGFSRVSEAVQSNMVDWCTKAFQASMKSGILKSP